MAECNINQFEPGIGTLTPSWHGKVCNVAVPSRRECNISSICLKSRENSVNVDLSLRSENNIN